MTPGIILFFIGFVVAMTVVSFCIFFDQAMLTRRETIYRIPSSGKRVALTFDDGPSPIWTSLVLKELKKVDIKATFFMTGYHVNQYHDLARQVAEDGHEIENHGYAHNVVLYYRHEELESEIKYTEYLIKKVTGQTTRYFRPPKAWIGPKTKRRIREMGYDVVLWSLNSKDWVTFDARHIVRFIVQRIKNGDILLFHDSGGVFKDEGGDRSQTVAAISLLADALREKGFQFCTINELIGEVAHV
jgi:peptidoglycan/xylan/chitin deacetylase (PgdA/CDA1 family)